MKFTASRSISAAAALSLALTAACPAVPAFAAEEISYIERTWNDEEKKVSGHTATASGCIDISTIPDVVGTTLKDNTYVVKGDVTFNNRLTVLGSVKLVLTDGSHLKCRQGIRTATNVGGLGNVTLSVYGQENDSGYLESQKPEDDKAGIGGDHEEYGGNVNIHGGRVSVEGGDDAAGIGGGYYRDGGSVKIYGGTVTAQGGSKGAAIGGGYAGNGSYSGASGLTVYDGTVTATGGYQAAGIGGGKAGKSSLNVFGGSTGFVTVNGGTVNATGGDNAAGIGMGSCNGGFIEASPSNTGRIYINGGTVTAQGGKNAAGIGGGEKNLYDINRDPDQTITVTGGTVNATGGDDGAGIGSGYQGCMLPVTVTGGTVTATGGKDGAGIGSQDSTQLSYEDGMGFLEVKGGDVTAIGRGGAAGIGGGYFGSEVSRVAASQFDVSITGGKVTARAEGGGNAIGFPDGVDSAEYYNKLFPLVIGGDMKVTSERTFTSGEKVPACRYRRAVTLEKCGHLGTNAEGAENVSGFAEFTKTDETHTSVCRYCGQSVTAQHSGDPCSVCGGQNDFVKVTVHATADDDTANDIVDDVRRGSDYTLPDIYEASLGENMIFKGWKIGDSDISGQPYTAVTVNSDTTIRAVIVQGYKVTAAETENGSVALSGKLAEAGQTVKVDALPDDGYKVGSVKCGGTELTAGTDGKYSFTMPAEAAEVSASFEKLSFSVQLPEGITLDGGEVEDGEADYGTTLKFKAPDGYEVRVNGETAEPDENGDYSVIVRENTVIALAALPGRITAAAECVYYAGGTDEQDIPAAGFVGTLTADNAVTVKSLTWTITPRDGEARTFTTQDSDYGIPNLTVEKGSVYKLGLIVTGLRDSYAEAELAAE